MAAEHYEYTPSYIETYAPTDDKLVHHTSVDFRYRDQLSETIHLVQYDNYLPNIKVDLKFAHEDYVLTDHDVVNVRVFKPDATFVYNPVLGCTLDKKSVYVEVTQAMTTAYGTARAIIEVVRESVGVVGTASFLMEIDRNPVQEDGIESTYEFKTLIQMLDMAASYANQSKSYAIGQTGIREGEDEDNAWYYYRMSRSYVKGDNGEREGEETDNGEYYYKATRSYAVGDTDFRDYEISDNAKYYYYMSRSYAVGTSGERDGEEVDNAKYYKEQAEWYYQQFYFNSTEAEAWAVGTRDGVPVDSEDYTYHNNSKWYAEESGECYNKNVTIAEELDRKLGMVSFNVDDDGYLWYTDNSVFDFVVDDEGDLLWEVTL